MRKEGPPPRAGTLDEQNPVHRNHPAVDDGTPHTRRPPLTPLAANRCFPLCRTGGGHDGSRRHEQPRPSSCTCFWLLARSCPCAGRPHQKPWEILADHFLPSPVEAEAQQEHSRHPHPAPVPPLPTFNFPAGGRPAASAAATSMVAAPLNHSRMRRGRLLLDGPSSPWSRRHTTSIRAQHPSLDRWTSPCGVRCLRRRADSCILYALKKIAGVYS
jgi:hypothetical protein